MLPPVGRLVPDRNAAYMLRSSLFPALGTNRKCLGCHQTTPFQQEHVLRLSLAGALKASLSLRWLPKCWENSPKMAPGVHGRGLTGAMSVPHPFLFNDETRDIGHPVVKSENHTPNTPLGAHFKFHKTLVGILDVIISILFHYKPDLDWLPIQPHFKMSIKNPLLSIIRNFLTMDIGAGCVLKCQMPSWNNGQCKGLLFAPMIM